MWEAIALVVVAAAGTTDDDGSKKVVGATAAVRSEDDRERDRWIERFTGEPDLRVGEGGAEVLLDPVRPDDGSRIFAALRRWPVPAEWTGARE